jgi:hypothetical protein
MSNLYNTSVNETKLNNFMFKTIGVLSSSLDAMISSI